MPIITTRLNKLALAAGIFLAAQSASQLARADSVPQALAGTWVCTFEGTGEIVTITAVAGDGSVKYQYNSEKVQTPDIEEGDDGGIEVNYKGFAWTLTPVSATEASFMYNNKKKHTKNTAPCKPAS